MENPSTSRPSSSKGRKRKETASEMYVKVLLA